MAAIRLFSHRCAFKWLTTYTGTTEGAINRDGKNVARMLHAMDVLVSCISLLRKAEMAPRLTPFQSQLQSNMMCMRAIPFVDETTTAQLQLPW